MTAALCTCRTEKGQQMNEGGGCCGWRVLTNSTTQLCHTCSQDLSLCSFSTLLCRPPFLTTGISMVFESSPTPYRWFSLCFGKKSHVRLRPMREGWRREGMGPGDDGNSLKGFTKQQQEQGQLPSLQSPLWP